MNLRGGSQNYSLARVGDSVTINGSSHAVLGNEPELGYMHLSIGMEATMALYRLLEAAGATVNVELPENVGAVVEVRDAKYVYTGTGWVDALGQHATPDPTKARILQEGITSD